jgi:hypothetical protein
MAGSIRRVTARSSGFWRPRRSSRPRDRSNRRRHLRSGA